MALPNGADVKLGSVSFRLDEGYQELTGRRCYVHGGRSIFAGRTDITGRPGAQNLKEDFLVWSLTRYDGEGQVVLDPADQDSQFRFYRSEGLNFRTPGQMKLNKSTVARQVATDNVGTTQQGAADFEDIVGTSNTSGTDREIDTVADQVGSAADVSYASDRVVTVDFYLFQNPFANYGTTIQGSALLTAEGHPTVSGSDVKLSQGEKVRTANLVTGTDFGAATIQRVECYLYQTGTQRTASVWVMDRTIDRVIAVQTLTISDTSSPSSPNVELSFNPKANHEYAVFFYGVNAGGDTTSQLVVDKLVYGNEPTENTATIEVWDATGAASVEAKTVQVNATAAGSKIGSIAFTATAANNYRARVLRVAGKQSIWVDKAEWRDDNAATGAWVLDCLDLGLGAQSAGVFTPKVWLAAHASGQDSVGFVYNVTNDDWDSTAILNTATGTDLTCRAMAHSDAAEYFLLDSGEIVSCTADGTDTLRATTIAGPVGMTVAQQRLWALSEGTNVIIYSIPLEAAAVNVTSDATVQRATILTGTKTPDTSLRQRMCSAPTGARYFLNFGDVTAKVYETDGTGTELTTREIADLGTGVKATSIAFESGYTFVGAQYVGDQSASDGDKKPRAVLFVIHPNGILQRIGFMRQDDPDVRPPQFIVPYQTDLFILQGTYVWRYDLDTGGLFLEYQLDPIAAGNQRALAVLFGRTFALYTGESFITGSVSTYRQSSVTGGNSFTSSVYDFGLPAVKKALARIDITTDTMASNTSVGIEYQTDQSGTWTLAGTHTSGSTSSFYIEETTFTSLQVRATLKSATGANTPVVRGLTVWASAAEDEEYFDLVLYTEDSDAAHSIDGDQTRGADKSAHVVDLWKRKVVTTFVDGYGSTTTDATYLVTIEDLRVEHDMAGEGRTVVTLRVVR